MLFYNNFCLTVVAESAPIGDTPDPHGPSNPSPIDSILGCLDFIPDMIEGLTTPLLEMDDDVLAAAESGKDMTNMTGAVRNGELINPAFDSANHNTILGDRSTFYKPKSHHFQNKRDELSHQTWARMPAIIETVDFPDEFTGETLIASYDMSPFIYEYRKRDLVGTHYPPCQILAMLHALWHGSLRYRFEYVGPRESTVRLAVVLAYGQFYNSTTTPSFAEAIQNPTIYITFDSRKREQTVEVAHINPHRWLKRPDLESEAAFSATRSSLGTMLVYQASGVSGINVPLVSPVFMNTWFSMSNDAAFQRFSPCPNMYVPTTASLKESDDIEIVEAESAVDATNANLSPEESIAVSSDDSSVNTAGTVTEAAVPQATPGVHYEAANKPNKAVEKIDITKLASKLFKLFTYTLDTSSSGSVIGQFNVPTDFNLAQAKLLISTGRYFRGDLRIRFTFNTGAFSGGLLFAYYLPYGVRYTDTNLIRISTLPHVELNVANSKPMDLFIPFSYFLDYFSLADTPSVYPNMGRVVIYCQRFTKPVTSARPTTLMAQFRWENLETFVPVKIPNITTSSPLPFHTSRLVVKPESGKISNLSGNTMTGLGSAISPAEQRTRKPTTPLRSVKIPTGNSSFQDEFYRPTVYAGGSMTLTSGESFTLDLFPLNQYEQTVVQRGNVYDFLRPMFAAFAGDTVYDIVVRTKDGLCSVVAGSYVQSTGTTDPKALVCCDQQPYTSSSWFPERFGGAPPTSNSAVVGAQLPVTTFQTPGKCRIVLPFLTPYRYVPAGEESWEEALPHESIVKGYFTVFNPSPDSVDFTYEVWRSPAKGARLSLFTGVAPICFDKLRETSGTLHDYPGTFFSN